MHLDADVMRNKANDAFRVGGRDTAAGIFEATRQPIDPQPTVGIEHHLDDAGVFQIGGDGRAERGAQHARAAGESFRPKRDRRHCEPRKFASLGGTCVSGVE